MFNYLDTTGLTGTHSVSCHPARPDHQRASVALSLRIGSDRRGSLPILILACLPLVFCLAFAVDFAKVRLRDSLLQQSKIERDPLYLPKSRYVRLVSLGYNTIVADVLWFDTLNYFGKQYSSGRDYRWLSSMCELVTTLNPEPLHTYEFCGTLLAWIAKKPIFSNQILDKAIAHHPDYWRFRYLRGFNYYYFLGNKERAVEDFVAGSKLDGAPLILSSLASRLMVEEDSPDVAVMFLASMYKRASDRNVRAALEDKLKRAILARDLQMLDTAVTDFQHKLGRRPTSLNEMVESKLIKSVPKEPFGGRYLLSHESGASPGAIYKFVTTSSGEKPLEFKGKTAKTGLFQDEFSAEGSESERPPLEQPVPTN